MPAQRYMIAVKAENPSDESQGVRELAWVLSEIDANLDVRLIRADPYTQDSASALQFVVTSPSDLPKVGRTIAEWLRRRDIYKITVQTEDGRSLLDAAAGADVAERVTTFLTGERLNRVITGTGNVITGGAVSGVVPVEPWPEPKKSR
jgi:hypothetical protein